MTQLIKSDLELSKPDNQIYQAYFTRKLQELDSKERFNLLTYEYLKFGAKVGHKPKDEAETSFEVQLLNEELQKYEWMTEDQLKLIFSKAIEGHFNDDVIFYSIANFHKWTKKFYEEIQRVEMKAIEANRKIEVKEMPNDNQQKQMAIQSANDYADMYAKALKSNQAFNFPYGGLSFLYDALEKFDMINLNIEEKLKIFNDVKALNPSLPNDELRNKSKSEAYKRFILHLASTSQRFNESGKLYKI